MIHQFDPQMAPDADFEPGTLAHLVPENEGRMLDPRRTPMRIASVQPETGTFVIEITGFEDRGARWELPIEDVSDCQFPHGAARADRERIGGFEQAVKRFDRTIEITCDDGARTRTLARLSELASETADWMRAHSQFVFEGATALPLTGRIGDSRLWLDVRKFMQARGLGETEERFASGYVSNPRSREMMKGHAIVLAELGLVPYRGPDVRNPATFEGALARERRAEHLLARMAFVRAVFERTGNSEVVLYRGMGFDDSLAQRSPRSFLSATFSEAVARSLYDPSGGTKAGVLYRQRTPASRLFMTYAETTQMNQAFKEAEAVLLGGDEGPLF